MLVKDIEFFRGVIKRKYNKATFSEIAEWSRRLEVFKDVVVYIDEEIESNYNIREYEPEFVLTAPKLMRHDITKERIIETVNRIRTFLPIATNMECLERPFRIYARTFNRNPRRPGPFRPTDYNVYQDGKCKYSYVNLLEEECLKRGGVLSHTMSESVKKHRLDMYRRKFLTFGKQKTFAYSSDLDGLEKYWQSLEDMLYKSQKIKQYEPEFVLHADDIVKLSGLVPILRNARIWYELHIGQEYVELQ